MSALSDKINRQNELAGIPITGKEFRYLGGTRPITCVSAAFAAGQAAAAVEAVG
ncbi:hypothetical protein OG563_47040 [Nocardia vinacea]|uniref:Uncharacterized protein n=1 Tax=Nocardia vinacea TaxID=96468 RepID=A0ABZ1YTB2_9NOCA|nr:hypothetical protein [Nocardia vinacea]